MGNEGHHGVSMEEAKAKEVIAECAGQRNAAAEAEMTIIEAIDKARWLEDLPDGFLSSQSAKATIKALHAALQSSRCFYNAVQRGQRTFVLVEQDMAAPKAIWAWAEAAEKHGCDPVKVMQAAALAMEWHESTLTRNGMQKKWPT